MRQRKLACHPERARESKDLHVDVILSKRSESKDLHHSLSTDAKSRRLRERNEMLRDARLR